MANYDENTIFVGEDERVSDVNTLNNLIDEIFRVGQYSDMASPLLNRNLVVLFNFLNENNNTGMSSGYMSRDAKDRERYALSVKQACKKFISDELVLHRVRHGYFEYLDESDAYFSDKKIDDIVNCGKTLKKVEVFTPLCMVAHIDEDNRTPHCHILYITHNELASLYSILNEYNGDEVSDTM